MAQPRDARRHVRPLRLACARSATKPIFAAAASTVLRIGEAEARRSSRSCWKATTGWCGRKSACFRKPPATRRRSSSSPTARFWPLARGGGRRMPSCFVPVRRITTWQRSDLGRHVGGPLLREWGDRLLVGGRKTKGRGQDVALLARRRHAARDSRSSPAAATTRIPASSSSTPTRLALLLFEPRARRDGRPITAIYLAELAVEP